MSEAPVQLFVAAFPGEKDADNALQEIKEARKQKRIDVIDVAVLRRDAKDKLHIRETADMGGGKGAAIGGAIGAAVGLLFPPSVILAGGVGAAIGGLAAKLRDSGFPDAHLREIGNALQPGTSAIVALIEHRWVADLERDLQAEGARIVRQTIAEDIRLQLESGRNVVYSAMATEAGAELSRVSSGADSLEVAQVTVTEEGAELVTITAELEPSAEESADVAPEVPAAAEAPKA